MTTNSCYTMPATGEAKSVRIAEFRRQIEHLERLVGCDWHSCANEAERTEWAWRARKIGGELISMVCKRATAADMDHRERAIERSTKLLMRLPLVAE